MDYSSADPSVPGVFECMAPHSKARQHQTEKPVELLRHLMKPLSADSVILDPFAGSGSTGEAALLEGHRVVLCEASPDYASIAAERVRNTWQSLRGTEFAGGCE